MEKQTKRIDLQTWEREGEGEMYGKKNMETYITICKIDSQWGICCMAQETQSKSGPYSRSGLGVSANSSAP